MSFLMVTPQGTYRVVENVEAVRNSFEAGNKDRFFLIKPSGKRLVLNEVTQGNAKVVSVTTTSVVVDGKEL